MNHLLLSRAASRMVTSSRVRVTASQQKGSTKSKQNFHEPTPYDENTTFTGPSAELSLEAAVPLITTKTLIESMPNKTKLETFLAKKYQAKEEDPRNKVSSTVYRDASFDSKHASKFSRSTLKAPKERQPTQILEDQQQKSRRSRTQMQLKKPLGNPKMSKTTSNFNNISIE